MMNIAVLSGKGGTGKTFVSVNLAAAIGNCCYVDCDVEEPNGYLFFKPNNVKVQSVNVNLPNIINDKCSGCRKCVDFCKFNALALVRDKPMLFSNVCHSCGGCKLVCPNDAIGDKEHEVGKIEIGTYKNITVKSGIMNLGEESGVSVIRKLLKNLTSEINVIDCPPGSACTVMESVKGADFCIIVAEPTIFGVHNFKMVYELVKLLNKPFGIIINKVTTNENPMQSLCDELNLEVFHKIPLDKEIAKNNADSKILYEQNQSVKIAFDELLLKISEVLK